jgi:hypothetical protein
MRGIAMDCEGLRGIDTTDERWLPLMSMIARVLRSRLFYLFKAVQMWGSHLIMYISVCVGAACSFYLMSTRRQQAADDAGLVLTYAFLLPYFMSTVSHHFTQVTATDCL